MAILKGKSDGGSGGTRGHSNMEQVVNHRADYRDYCRACGGGWDVPGVVDSPELRNRVSTAARAKSAIQAMHLLRGAGYGLNSAKATVAHISNPKGHCHRCGRSLSNESDAECSFCHSLNYHW